MHHRNEPYLIGETAFHHEGDKNFLYELIDAGVTTGVDALKFHLLFDVFDYMIENHTAIDVIRKICIPEQEWPEILSYVSEKGVDVVLLCNDVRSLQWVNEHQHLYNIEAIEIHATGINDIFLLNEALKFKKTVILGIGGSTFDEIKYAVDFFRTNNKTELLLMHGFQNYPTRYEDVNLKRMKFLEQAFNCTVGYADHTDPADEYVNMISVLPQGSGFRVLEKHYTHVYGTKRIDAQAAVSLDDLRKTRMLMKAASSAFGDGNFTLSIAERNYGDTGPMKKAIVAREHINEGDTLSLQNLAFRRTNQSSLIRQIDIDKLIGAVALKPIAKDELVDFSAIEYKYKQMDFSQFFVDK